MTRLWPEKRACDIVIKMHGGVKRIVGAKAKSIVQQGDITEDTNLGTWQSITSRHKAGRAVVMTELPARRLFGQKGQSIHQLIISPEEPKESFG